MKNKRALVIVAHPDDETIWMGGTLLKNRWDKTIITLCRKEDMDRRKRFEKACKSFNARGFISDLDDSEKGDFKKVLNEDIINRILSLIKERDYDYIFTHGKNGEYGHIRHKEVHNAVTEMLNKKILSAKKVFFFSYVKKGKFCYVNKNADKLIRLKKLYFEMKKKIIQDIYGFEEGSFENKCSGEVESFDIKRK